MEMEIYRYGTYICFFQRIKLGGRRMYCKRLKFDEICFLNSERTLLGWVPTILSNFNLPYTSLRLNFIRLLKRIYLYKMIGALPVAFLGSDLSLLARVKNVQNSFSVYCGLSAFAGDKRRDAASDFFWRAL